MVTRRQNRASSRLRVALRRPTARDAKPFLAAVGASRALHASWVSAPSTPAAFRDYVTRFGEPLSRARNVSYLATTRDDGSLIGVLNLSEIVRGAFQSAYLGYYAFRPHARRGYMTEALVLLLDIAFDDLHLHRVEVNVQPTNTSSLALVERIGFTREGYSRRYVKVGARWRDHVRFAMLAEEWSSRRRAVLAGLVDRSADER